MFRIISLLERADLAGIILMIALSQVLRESLFIHLLARGLIDHDPLALGIAALPTGEVLRYRAGPTGWLFTIGAPLKGLLWETTAAPEIRVHARALAATLLAR